MRVSVSLSLALVLGTPFAAAQSPGPVVEDGVAAVFVKLADARTRGDAVAARALLKLPLRTTWHSNDGQGECSVPHSKTEIDPLRAAAALKLDPRFLSVMRGDKGRTHQGTGCEEESSTSPFTHGDPAISVTGDKATVRYRLPVCEAGAPEYAFTLSRVAGVWSIVGYDSGCHYEES